MPIIFSEGVTPAQLRLLRDAPYHEPLRVSRAERLGPAAPLLERGLLEANPDSPSHVRRTDKGDAVAAPLTMAAAKRALERIAALEEDDPEAAASLEVALFSRTLVEGALLERGEIPLPTFCKIVEAVLEGR